MKPWNRRKWLAASAGHAHVRKVKADRAKRRLSRATSADVSSTGPAHEPSTSPTGQELLIWADDGGAAE